MGKSKTSPTQRTIQRLRGQGCICGVVERWNPYAGPINPKTGNPSGIRQDLFKFNDVICLTGGAIIGIQCCAGSGHAAHRHKILANEVAPRWLASGGRIEIWSWSKTKVKRGGVAVRWTPRVELITADDFKEPDDDTF